MTMDPITLISIAPPEWVVPLILVAIAYKAWQLWILRDKDDDDVTPAVG